MKRYILFFLLFSSRSLVQAQTKLDFFINKEVITIYKYEKQRISTSLKCDNIEKGAFCDELSFLQDLKSFYPKTPLRGGQHIGSAICNEKLSGTIIIAKTSLGDENAFCKIGKDLYVEFGTIAYYYNQGNNASL